MNNRPAVEERVWAVLSHLSAITFGMGIFLPVLGWSQQRRKSNYASFQSLQALGYQTLWYTVWILLSLVIATVQLLNSVGKMADAVEAGADIYKLTTMVMGEHSMSTLGLIFLYLILPIIAAIACAFGRDFRYPFMGNRLARYVGYSSEQTGNESDMIEEHEDRWVAGMGHFSVIIVLWGMLTPIMAWALEGKRSLFLKFQAVQAFVFQLGALLLLFGGGVLYLGGAISFIFMTGINGSLHIDSPTVMTGTVIFLVSSLCSLIVLLVVPLLHIMGQWAGYRVLKGDEYRYPIVGKLVEKRIK